MRNQSIGRLFSLGGLAGLCLAAQSSGIIIRHDQSDDAYRARGALSDFAAVGFVQENLTGTLIGRKWLLTAAHVSLPQRSYIDFGNRRVFTSRVVVHPSYVPGQVNAFDMQLLELENEITDITPLAIFGGGSVVGREVTKVGFGATGNGLIGESSPTRGVKRASDDRFVDSDSGLVGTRFDAPNDPNARALEGQAWSGDSGGPMLIQQDGQWQIAGMMLSLSANAQGQFDRYGAMTWGSDVNSQINWIREITGIPTPGTAGLVGIAALAAARRRR